MAELRIAQISDIHLDYGATRLGSPKIVSGINMIHRERVERLSKCVRHCVKREVDAIVLSGDIHNKPRPVAQEYADLYEILDEVPSTIPIFAIPGNHDESTSRGSPLLPLSGRRESIHVIFEPRFVRIQNVIFLFAPWGTPIEEIEMNLNERPEDHKVLVYHVGVTGIDNMNWGEVTDEPGTVHIDRLKDLNCVGIMLGHHHNQTELAKNIWYAGSPECFNFGERDQNKGFLIWHFHLNGDNCHTEVERCQTDYPKFKAVHFHHLLEIVEDRDFFNSYIRIDGEVTTEQRSDIIQRVHELDGCLGVKYNLKLITDRQKSKHIPGKTHEAILRNYLGQNHSYTDQQIQKFLEIDQRIESEVVE